MKGATTKNRTPLSWVKELQALCRPAAIHWCDGSQQEYDRMIRLMIDGGTARALDPKRRLNSYLILSDPGDVARVEDRTFICSEKEEDAGPTNNWHEPADMKNTLKGLFEGSMAGRDSYETSSQAARLFNLMLLGVWVAKYEVRL